MKSIINSAWELENMDVPKLAKYMRCLFQVAISDHVDVAEQLLEQVYAQAVEASEVSFPPSPPVPPALPLLFSSLPSLPFSH